MKKSKLAIFTGSDLRNFGGAEKDAILMANMLCNDFDITLFTPTDKSNLRVNKEYVENLIDKKIEILYYPAIKIFFGTDIIPKGFKGIKDILLIRKFDFVYAYTPSVILDLILIFICKVYNVKFIFGIHTPDYFKEKSTINSPIRNLLLRPYKMLKFYFVRQTKIIRIQNLADFKRLKQIGYKGKIYNIPPFINLPKKIRLHKAKRFIVLSVSRLSIKHKGIDLLCDVIEKTINKNNEILFYIVGSGDDGEPLVRDLENKYPKNVKWLGFVDEKYLYKLYQQASLFISTSRGENFGINVAEAQVNGLPTIAFNVMGSQDILTEKIQGTLVEPFNTAKFSDEIIKSYKFYKKDIKKYIKLKLRISNMAIKKYNYKIISNKITKMFIN